MKTISLVCAECGKTFEKPLNEYTRQVKKGRERFFCSIGCGAVLSNRENPRPVTEGNYQHLKQWIDDNGNPKLKDDLSPFRWFTRRIRNRLSSGRGVRKFQRIGVGDVSESYLKTIWENQMGVCPFTGQTMTLPLGSEGFANSHPNNASLDRIDNEIGYFEGNVRFVSLIANYARNIFTDEQVIEFCREVAACQ